MNLELIINNEPWHIVMCTDKKRDQYCAADTQTKTLYIYNTNNQKQIDQYKDFIWRQYNK